MKLDYIITNNDTYSTVKEVLKAYFWVSDRLLIKLKKNNKIYLNDKITNINSPVSTRDKISFVLDFIEDNSNIVSSKMDLNIIYEDEAYIVLNKPAGIPVHPSMDHYTDSLSNGLKYYFESIGLKRKLRPINRLDKNTSGLVIFAKNEYVQECLIRQMKNNLFYKEYIAMCEGRFEKEKDIINVPISRKENSIIERCVDSNGDTAITEYEILQYNKNDNYSVVKCILKTGRTHQIRVHTSYIGHPVLGDTLYGHPSDLINRQALHSLITSFIHPITKEKVIYTAPLFPDMIKLVNKN